MLYYVPLAIFVIAAAISVARKWRESRRLKKIHEKFPIVGSPETPDLTEALIEGTAKVRESITHPSPSMSACFQVALIVNTKS